MKDWSHTISLNSEWSINIVITSLKYWCQNIYFYNGNDITINHINNETAVPCQYFPWHLLFHYFPSSLLNSVLFNVAMWLPPFQSSTLIPGNVTPPYFRDKFALLCQARYLPHPSPRTKPKDDMTMSIILWGHSFLTIISHPNLAW